MKQIVFVSGAIRPEHDEVSIKQRSFSANAKPQLVKSGTFLGIPDFVDITEYDCGFIGCNHLLKHAEKMDKITSLVKSGLHQIGCSSDIKDNSLLKEYCADTLTLSGEFLAIEDEKYTDTWGGMRFAMRITSVS